jgi:hypothetical protein
MLYGHYLENVKGEDNLESQIWIGEQYQDGPYCYKARMRNILAQ